MTIAWQRAGDKRLTLEVRALKKEILMLRKAVGQLQKDVAVLQAESARKPPVRGVKAPASDK